VRAGHPLLGGRTRLAQPPGIVISLTCDSSRPLGGAARHVDNGTTHSFRLDQRCTGLGPKDIKGCCSASTDRQIQDKGTPSLLCTPLPTLTQVTFESLWIGEWRRTLVPLLGTTDILDHKDQLGTFLKGRAVDRYANLPNQAQETLPSKLPGLTHQTPSRTPPGSKENTHRHPTTDRSATLVELYKTLLRASLRTQIHHSQLSHRTIRTTAQQTTSPPCPTSLSLGTQPTLTLS
jgi:hypothetical protein